MKRWRGTVSGPRCVTICDSQRFDGKGFGLSYFESRIGNGPKHADQQVNGNGPENEVGVDFPGVDHVLHYDPDDVRQEQHGGDPPYKGEFREGGEVTYPFGEDSGDH